MKRFLVMDTAGRFLTENGFTTYYHFEAHNFGSYELALSAAYSLNATVEMI